MSENRKRRKMVSIRLSEEEFTDLKEKADTLGETVPAFLRKKALGQRVRSPLVDREAGLEMAKQLRAIGNNVNQIARKVNQGDPQVDLTAIRKELNEIWQSLSSKLQK
ncbi:plasmid mobilization relaxosome protein MobC [Aquibacillus koreensis]|uniref:Plasmid mobilization relaxosome protein MobC n=1 Tax=Aquibacillus koreensis TaxID=279446 RepID=A0A9X3WQ82_9BACI|nr:plasmid mobilization relaxosome protein MobC [Aquibacillus koreensis]MDC3422863.1 plasmid mobilization relaxosome protein MobC [Aquibacillus koreensis]